MRVSAFPAFRSRRSNPYNALLYDALVARGVEVVEFDARTVVTDRADVVHVHWPESALNKPRRLAAAGRSVELLVVLARARRGGARVVWTAHNPRSHFGRYPRAERLWWRAFVRLVDGWISLSPAAESVVLEEHPRLARVPRAVVPHGHYRDAYPDAPRAGGETSDRVLAFVGRVKPYKGVPELVAAFRGLDDSSTRLLVAGRCDDAALADELRRLAAGDSRVELRLEEVPEDSLVGVLRRADLVVLPFRAILNSGSALLALSFDTPVLCPRVGALVELADRHPDWVTTYDGPLTADVLQAALRRPRPDGRPDLGYLDWDAIAAQTADFYDAVAHRAVR